MWAQLISVRLKAGKEDQLPKLYDELAAIEQSGSGLVRSLAMRDQKDPSRAHMLVVFESEEAARARENDERRQQGLEKVRAVMAVIFDGPPEFTDLIIDAETVP